MNYVYTAIFDSYDELKDIKLIPGWQAICFTNCDIVSKTWKIIKLEKSEKIYRDIKIRPYKYLPEHIRSIWIDGNLELIDSLQFLVNKGHLCLMTHPDRDCIYKEAERCIELKKDSFEVISSQMERYRTLSYPENNGLVATGVIVRTHNFQNMMLGEIWWDEVQNHSVRDQLSFNFVAHNRQIPFETFPFLQGFQYHYHLHRIKAQKEKAEKKAARRKFRKTRRVKGLNL